MADVAGRATGPAAAGGAAALAARMAARGRRAWFPALLGVSLALVLAFLALPVLAIFLRTTPARLLHSLDSDTAAEALRLSFETSAIAMAVTVAVGTPAAYLLATRRFRGRALALTVVELPIVLPPAAAGIGLLAALGPDGLLGGTLRGAGLQLQLQTASVVVALAFVSAPFYIRQAEAAFAAMDRSLLETARALGAGEGRAFLRIAIPLARPGLVAGLALAWGRALGEFGATLMFAGSYQGITQTAPLAIYDQFATDLPAALALSAVLVAVSAALLLTVKLTAGITR